MKPFKQRSWLTLVSTVALLFFVNSKLLLILWLYLRLRLVLLLRLLWFVMTGKDVCTDHFPCFDEQEAPIMARLKGELL